MVYALVDFVSNCSFFNKNLSLGCILNIASFLEMAQEFKRLGQLLYFKTFDEWNKSQPFACLLKVN